MQKRILLEADVDECGLQAGLEVLDLALEHAGDDPFLRRAFDGELLELAVLHDRHAVLQRFRIDDDFFDEFLAATTENLLALPDNLFHDFHFNKPSGESTRFVTAPTPSCWPTRTIRRS